MWTMKVGFLLAARMKKMTSCCNCMVVATIDISLVNRYWGGIVQIESSPYWGFALNYELEPTL